MHDTTNDEGVDPLDVATQLRALRARLGQVTAERDAARMVAILLFDDTHRRLMSEESRNRALVQAARWAGEVGYE